ncbi:hypothetical protein C5B42_03420 [Candidatus Cerribacteria bacterium 'Amazon FNV 2010 28 9']|uniref:Uncharacterized protein n=1 Tax=Candidatus Cerribacteria bacterium 'Amazon FNV 2010 28 9' TaxID=2081795 RepID=A0A317JPU0_9BACT|nr:MAG: hypothetical protein C5B42_03420 [Candidatus Cerribacteria bacterium 'Amazon FNV 2010 28 9']
MANVTEQLKLLEQHTSNVEKTRLVTDEHLVKAALSFATGSMVAEFTSTLVGAAPFYIESLRQLLLSANQIQKYLRATKEFDTFLGKK